MNARAAHLRAVEADEPRSGRGRAPYSDAFKAAAVARVAAGQPVATVAREQGVARNTLKAWVAAAADAPAGSGSRLTVAASTGSRRAVLIALRDEIAEKIDAGISTRDMPANARLLAETMREIEAIDAQEEADEREADTVEDEPFDPEMI